MRPRGALVAVALALIALPPCRALSAGGGGFAGGTLAEALERLRGEGLNIVYSSELVRPEVRVVDEPSGRTPREVLGALLESHGLAVSEGPGGVLLVVRGARADAVPGTIRGTVVASDTGEPFPGVEVRVAETGGVARSDASGGFVFEGLRPGEYTLHVRCPGYVETVVGAVTVAAAHGTEVAIELKPRPMYLQEVEVTPSRTGFLHAQPEARRFLSRDEVQALPHLSDDLFRVVQWLPGTSSGDISSEFGLRGGAPDEVMFRLDGMQIHDPYHLRDFFSLFSVVDSEIVAGMDVLSGGFPVEYGDRMSGVVDLTSVVPEELGWSLGATGVHARAQAGGPWGDGQGSWLVSARRGYLDWLLYWLAQIGEEPDITGTPTYWDVYATARHRVGRRSVLSAHVLTSHDDVRAEDIVKLQTATGRSASWYLWATLDASFGGGLSGRTVASATNLKRTLQGSSQPGAVGSTQVRDDRSFSIYGIDQGWVLEPWRNHLLKWGFEVRWVAAEYDLDSTFLARDPIFTGSGSPQLVGRSASVRPTGTQLGAYAAERVRLAPGVTAEAGVRWDHQSWTPGDDQLSPRLNLVWETRGLGTVRGSWGRFAQSQAIYQLQVEDGIDTFFPAEWADHTVLSWERALPSGLMLRVEGYRKVMTSLRPRFENLFEGVELFPEGGLDRVEVAPERAEAHGLELLVKSQGGRWFAWWVGGALSTVEDEIDGEWVPRSWDQRRVLSFSLNWMVRSSWSLNLAGLYHSGWPTTYGRADSVLQPDGSWTIASELGARNAERLPSYQRVDLRVGRSFALGTGRAHAFLEIMNLLNHDNARCRYGSSFGRAADGSLTIRDNEENWFPIFVSLGFIVSF